ncbi:LANO_0F07646g1_1 [Lachancea nothofagi CBS 11611]|uniref:LANO_0F07646g1_1 n=1 Tax=Lachancea nothofagi CBS 11611 TaxID=1266666 RepID=A0A1G4K938_9SACH|nr:LANO_0F07646g1_1 [Lachancea nothofagi CBS 11611]
MSDSDSDFGDFEGASDSEEQLMVSPEKLLETVLGPRQAMAYTNKKHDLSELIRDERPRVVYEQLVVLDPHLRPFQWRHSRLRSELLHTLQIEDVPETPKVTKVLDNALYKCLEPFLGNPESGNVSGIQSILGDKLLAPERLPTPKPTALELKIKDIDSLNEQELSETHDQLIDALLAVCGTIHEIREVRAQLDADKEMFEDLVTNLVGHTQRIRRDEIAKYNKKNKRSLKYGKKFKWVR